MAVCGGGVDECPGSPRTVISTGRYPFSPPPTSPIPPFRLGEKTDDPLQMYLADIFTVSVNLVGLPGISVPCGLVETPGPAGVARLPIGFQLVGKMFDETTVLRVADAFERTTDWSRQLPPS